MHITLNLSSGAFAGEIKDISGANVFDCYQCGKCAAGCTVGGYIDDTPTKVIRFIQLNQRDKALDSRTPFLCAACNTCSERCPMEIDVAKIMESVRILALKEKRKPEKDVAVFSELFLGSVKTTGRLFELGLTAGFNLMSGQPVKDAELGARLFRKGKIAIKPAMSGNKNVKQIFNKSEAVSGSSSKEEKAEH